jgi:hypothetical protein
MTIYNVFCGADTLTAVDIKMRVPSDATMCASMVYKDERKIFLRRKTSEIYCTKSRAAS